MFPATTSAESEDSGATPREPWRFCIVNGDNSVSEGETSGRNNAPLPQLYGVPDALDSRAENSPNLVLIHFTDRGYFPRTVV